MKKRRKRENQASKKRGKEKCSILYTGKKLRKKEEKKYIKNRGNQLKRGSLTCLITANITLCGHV